MTHPPSLLRRAVHGLLLIAMLASTLGTYTPALRAAPLAETSADPTSVTIAGNLQEELGCPGDWQPECATTHLAYDTNDDLWQETFTIPAGAWEYKATLNDSWDEAYPSNNIGLDLTAETAVKFYYDHKTNWVTDNQRSVIATAAGNFQDELGCSGDWAPDCLRSWLQDKDGDGIYTFATTAIPAGSYAGKAALNEGWDEAYPNDNVGFTVNNDGDNVLFSYNSTTNEFTIDAGAPVGPGYAVALVGSLQSELGCAGDWQPECANTEFTFDENDDVWQATFTLPAGAWEYKAALNDSWDEAYPSNNIALDLAAETDVKFYYDNKSHWVTDNQRSVIATAAGSFQDELGCSGDWAPDCLRSWLQDMDGDGVYTFATTAIPAGSYEGKAALNEGWDTAYPANNVPFTVANAGDTITFSFDSATNEFTIDDGSTPPPPTNIEYAVIHYNRPAGDYTGWGLHLWGDGLDPAEGTTWDAPKQFAGVDGYGAFVAVKLTDPSKPVNFIIHKGNDKDTPNDRSFIPDAFPHLWLKQGDAGNYASRAAVTGKTVVHYQRADSDYSGWGLHLWGDGLAPGEATDWSAPKPFISFDDYGGAIAIQVTNPISPVNFIVHKGDVKDPDADLNYTPAENYEVWVKSGDTAVYDQRGAAEDFAIIHYHRKKADYDGWGLHLWEGSAETGVEWGSPFLPTGEDAFGKIFKVNLQDAATRLAYIVHKGDEKDLSPNDQFLVFADKGYEIWLIQDSPTQITDPALAWAALAASGGAGDLTKQQAYFVDRATIAWPAATDASATYLLHAAPNAGLTLEKEGITGGDVYTLTLSNAGLSDAAKEKFPHLATLPALTLPGEADPAMLLKGQLAVSALDSQGTLLDATGLQIPGVLDDLYTFGGDLGVTWSAGVPNLALWAPTAQSVTLHLFDTSTISTSTTYTMTWDGATGVWSKMGMADWVNKYYLFEVDVYAPSTQQIETNIVTDPYAVSLSTNSARSQIVDLTAAALKPTGWDDLAKPALGAPEDISIYEIHVRDFSVNDPTVPENLKGTFKAFTLPDSNGVKHLKALEAAGLSHLHLLPVFDIATIDEDKANWQTPDFTDADMGPASEDQQAAVVAVENTDAFNWGYDPFHYGVPEGSYSTNPDGTTRIVEFREMVEALNKMGLRVVVDVVYNHTNAAGQAEKSVLDKIVPGYYQRLNASGQVESSTCCANTATEHNMMEKLMVDTLVIWAKAYKVDAFRFDLMGHHMVRNMQAVRDALDALTVETDGVDGKSIYLYGEGWNFGEVVDNTRGINATQINMAGTGIGTFSDRLRDAVRGPSPFASGQDLKTQGFANGLFYDPNDLAQGGADAQKERLLLLTDQIKVGMAGNLADYEIVDRTGATVKGSQVDYNGQPAGYTKDPQEVITYIDKHDNQTLYDINAYAVPTATSMADRVRIQTIGQAVVLLGQGVPFIHAGSDILRSKSLDRDSYNSGDWFNKLDFTYQSNNFGVGLPVASKNQENWPIMTPFLANPALVPAQADIEQAGALFQELLQIRYSSPLFRLQTAEEIMDHVHFYNNGPEQIPGLIVMGIFDDARLSDIDPAHESVAVLVNANDEAQTFTHADFAGREMVLHPVQAGGVDAVVKTSSFNSGSGTFTVPGRTAAVFVETDAGLNYKVLLVGLYQFYTPDPPVTPDPLDVELAQPAITAPAQQEIVYFVMTDRFANGDMANDYGGAPTGSTVTETLASGFLPSNTGYYHGGDIAGLTAKLDYLAGMGVTAIWMTPPFENDVTQGNGTVEGSTAGYHGYWGTDFLDIDPHLGTKAEFAELVTEAHAREIKVFLDIVINHTGDVISYDGGVYDYVTKADTPYKDASGTAFDDRDYAGGTTFPALDAGSSFPYSATFASPDLATVKNPAWLNDPIYYHNRGDSTFAGESSLYGDFFGLDDLFTEQPAVVDGMIELYKSWITDYGVDGYRIDTVKHVNTEFWQAFAPAILAHAAEQGKDDFVMFGEVFNGDPAYLSSFTTEAKLPSVLDFGFQGAATNFAVNGGATDNLRDFFAKDDYYTDADSNAYGLATFLSNHDSGRIGYGLTGLNVTENEMLARDKLAQGLMLFSRGFPVVYYGDEQGFVGGGSDRESREDMFPSQVASYNDNNLIGTSATTAVDNFDTSHPLYTALADFAALRKAHPALSDGAQIHRYSSANAGVYAFSRIDRDEQIEYVLLFNNSKAPQQVRFPVFKANTAYTRLYPAGSAVVNTNSKAEFTVQMQPLSFAIYRQGATLRQAEQEEAAKAAVTPIFTLPTVGGEVGGRAEIAVNLSRSTFAEVTFAVSVDGGDWTVIGTDNNPPYRVFWTVGELAKGTPITFRAIVRDLFEETLTSATVNAVAGEPAGTDAGYAIIHYNRPAGDYAGWGLHLWGDAIDPTEATEWSTPKLPTGEDAYGMFWAVKLADSTQAVNFIIHKGDEKDGDADRAMTPADGRQIWIAQGDAANHMSQAAAQGFTTIHYQRADADYTGWGLHLWQETGDLTEWSSPLMHTMTDTFGVTFVISKTAYASLDFTKPLNFIVHKGDAKDTDADRSYTPATNPSIWLKSGDTKVYKQLGAAENFVVIHYKRPAGDYDGWGLHMWTGYDSATGGAVEWATPFLPTGEDAFGKVYQVPVVTAAGGLAYIMHKGDEKDLPDDQYLDFAQDGHEVWILQSTPGYLLPMP